METLKSNWFLIAGTFVAWRWYVSDKAGVPIGFALLHPFTADPATLRALFEATLPKAGIVIPITEGASITLEGEIVKIL